MAVDICTTQLKKNETQKTGSSIYLLLKSGTLTHTLAWHLQPSGQSLNII